MKDMVTMVLSLIIFATVACVGLAFVYDGTKDQIALNKTEKLTKALSQIFSGAEFTEAQGNIASDGVSFGTSEFKPAYTASRDGKIVGIALIVSKTGFSDIVTALVGVGSDGKIAGVRILQNTDTPGLGANASSPAYFIDKPKNTTTFFGQFKGMSVNTPIKVRQDGGDVTAITAATITSRVVALLVDRAAKAGSVWLSENGITGNGGAK
ncbi:MAG: FMN-binding protein [Spirochaetaceae bacterium]|jgi:electron transport complex protein RnfG|nr:FMN-binding protein [Spirochaetaceae bacterium]